MSQKPSLLIVDDHADNLKVASSYLKEEGYNISLAFNGEEALSILREVSIDLILLDIMMPGMDGYTVAQTIKNQPSTQKIPIIFLTARSEIQDMVKGFSVGGTDYITKPFSKWELLVRVNHHIELSRAYQTIQERNAELEQVIKTRDTIYAIIGHDIKGPFIEIMTFVDMLSKGHIQPGDKNFKEFIDSLSDKTRSTYNLLHNLLNWTMIQLDKTVKKEQPFLISQEINECISLFAQLISKKKIQVQCHIPEKESMIKADQNMINTVLRNLINNAIKFTNRGGQLSIHLHEENSYIILKIADTGIGMEPETIRIIESGQSPKPCRGTNNEKGNGLGFQLIKHFLSLHKATLSIESQVKKGSTITIKIPQGGSDESTDKT